MSAPDTIFALSSGLPPAAIGVIRISGPGASHALASLVGKLPLPRRASHRILRDRNGAVIDDGLILWLPGPSTATGEDSAEIHCHGGRAVVAAIETALADVPGLRRATAGEFTRRAFANGRIDLAEAEGLADLLAAETELQRQSARALAGGALSRMVTSWRERVLTLSAEVEAAIDFSDEDDVAPLSASFAAELKHLRADIASWLEQPSAEMLSTGVRVVISGPPNAGKSTLFNALVESEAAIASPIAGTTRDVLVRSVSLSGVPFQLMDTAGLAESTTDVIEAIGIDRARAAVEDADLVLWLGVEGEGPACAWEIESFCDGPGRTNKLAPRHRVSALTGEGLAPLRQDMVEYARTIMPKPGAVALNDRHRHLLRSALDSVGRAGEQTDVLLIAEELRLARAAFDSLIGRTSTEDMLDTLFGRFCIGK